MGEVVKKQPVVKACGAHRLVLILVHSAGYTKKLQCRDCQKTNNQTQCCHPKSALDSHPPASNSNTSSCLGPVSHKQQPSHCPRNTHFLPHPQGSCKETSRSHLFHKGKASARNGLSSLSKRAPFHSRSSLRPAAPPHPGWGAWKGAGGRASGSRAAGSAETRASLPRLRLTSFQ